MIRESLLFVYVLSLCAYAWRDWFKSLCGLILLMAVMEHPDMPKTILGIQGLNPWNLLFLSVGLAWLVRRRREGLVLDVPVHVAVLGLLYVGVIGLGFTRMILNPAGLDPVKYPTSYLWNEYLINTLKWPVPALLLYDGARTRGRQKLAMFSIVGLYFFLALQVIRWIPPSFVLSSVGDFSHRSIKLIQNEIGHSRVTMSMLLAGGSWAMLMTQAIVARWWQKGLIVIGFLAMVYAQALTGGRMGYGTWAVVGLAVGLARYRRYLPLALVVPLLVALFAPAVVGRVMQGIGQDSSGDESVDAYELTSGRNLAWPLVIDMIKRSPVVGWGQQAMIRTGITAELGAESESFPHPHNAYLELLLDNGWLGFVLVIPFYLVTLFHALRLFFSRGHPYWVAGAGVCTCLVLAFLVAGVGSHTFYPRSSTFGMWCSIALMYRLSRERAWLRSGAWAEAWRAAAWRLSAPASPSLADGERREGKELPFTS